MVRLEDENTSVQEILLEQKVIQDQIQELRALKLKM
jgi:hypothetical protein